MLGLFLDDERNPSDVTWVDYPSGVEWVIVRTHSEFVGATNNKIFDIISFDHDLGENSETGYRCIKDFVELFLSGKLTKYARVYVHSKNPVGARNISNYWKSFLKYKGMM